MPHAAIGAIVPLLFLGRSRFALFGFGFTAIGFWNSGFRVNRAGDTQKVLDVHSNGQCMKDFKVFIVILFNPDKRIFNRKIVGLRTSLGVIDTIDQKNFEFVRSYLAASIIKQEIPRQNCLRLPEN